MKKTEAKAVPVVQIVNAIKNRHSKESTGHEAVRRTSEEYKTAKAEGKNVTRIFDNTGCFILVPVKSNGKLTAHGERLRKAFLGIK